MLPNIPIYLSAVFCVFAAIIVLLFVIPLQIKQAGVKNGLSMLRRQLLIFGITVFITNTIAAYFLARTSISLYMSGGHATFTTSLLLFIFAFSMFVIAAVGYQIYHQQYVLEHKD